MEKIVVLDGATLGNVDYSQLEKFGEVKVYPTTAPEQRQERVADATIIVTNKVVIDGEVFDSAPRLKMVQITATGMNNVDLEEAKKRGIVVKNVAGYSTESVAQQTLGMVLNLIQNLNFLDTYAKTDYLNSPIFTKIIDWWEIKGKQWGIIGLGNIGRRVAKIAETFGARVVYYSTSGRNFNPDYRRMELEELLQTSQIVSIHAPLTPFTRGLLDKKRLQLLPDGAVLVNVGRGGIVVEKDLAEILKTKPLLVGLDVFEKEPISPDNPLLHLPENIPGRLLLTPHTAWTSREALEKLWKGVVTNISTFLAQTSSNSSSTPGEEKRKKFTSSSPSSNLSTANPNPQRGVSTSDSPSPTGGKK